MPERLFKYEDKADLVTIAKDLSRAVREGNTQEMRQSTAGFLVRTGPVTVTQLRALYLECRLEIFLRGRGSTPSAGDGDPELAAMEPVDPRREKVMSVETDRQRRSAGYNLIPPSLP